MEAAVRARCGINSRRWTYVGAAKCPVSTPNGSLAAWLLAVLIKRGTNDRYKLYVLQGSVAYMSAVQTHQASTLTEVSGWTSVV